MNVGSLATALDRYAHKGWIVSTPKITVNVCGPIEGDIAEAILDTGAEANVMPLSMAQGLGYPILGTEHLKLKTVSSQVIGFLGIAKVYVKVKHRVSYKTVFFLIKNSLVVLLG